MQQCEVQLLITYRADEPYDLAMALESALEYTRQREQARVASIALHWRFKVFVVRLALAQDAAACAVGASGIIEVRMIATGLRATRTRSTA